MKPCGKSFKIRRLSRLSQNCPPTWNWFFFMRLLWSINLFTKAIKHEKNWKLQLTTFVASQKVYAVLCTCFYLDCEVLYRGHESGKSTINVASTGAAQSASTTVLLNTSVTKDIGWATNRSLQTKSQFLLW